MQEEVHPAPPASDSPAWPGALPTGAWSTIAVIGLLVAVLLVAVALTGWWALGRRSAAR